MSNISKPASPSGRTVVWLQKQQTYTHQFPAPHKTVNSSTIQLRNLDQNSSKLLTRSSHHIKEHKRLLLCNLPPSPPWRFHEFVHRTNYIGWPPRLWTDHFLLTPFHTEPCPRPPPLIHVCSAFQWIPSSSKLLDTTKVSCNIQLVFFPHPTMSVEIFRLKWLSKLNCLQDICTLQVTLPDIFWGRSVTLWQVGANKKSFHIQQPHIYIYRVRSGMTCNTSIDIKLV